MVAEALALFDEAGDELVNDYHVLVRIGGLVLPYDRDRTELSLYNSMRMFARKQGLFASRRRPGRTPYSPLSTAATRFLKTHPLPRLEAPSPSETPPKPSASAAAACGAAPPVEASQDGEPLTLRTLEPQCGHSPEAMAAPSTPAPSSARTPAPPTPPPARRPVGLPPDPTFTRFRPPDRATPAAAGPPVAEPWLWTSWRPRFSPLIPFPDRTRPPTVREALAAADAARNAWLEHPYPGRLRDTPWHVLTDCASGRRPPPVSRFGALWWATGRWDNSDLQP